jgi:hypothetical protein
VRGGGNGGGVARCTATTSSRAWGARPSLHNDIDSLHDGGGGVRRGPIKRRPPCEVAKMVPGDSDLHGEGLVGTTFCISGMVLVSTLLAIAGGSHGESRWRVCVIGGGGGVLACG